MPFRRRFFPKRSAGRFSRFRRGRAALRSPTEPKRWEVGRVFISTSLTLEQAPGDPNQVTFIPLAQVYNRVGDVGTAQGRTLNNLVRRMEVGGVVLDYSVMFAAQNLTLFGDSDEPKNVNQWNNLFAKFILASDRMFEDGSPSSLTPNMFTSTNPVIGAGSTTTPDDEEQSFPMRIHYEDTFFTRLLPVTHEGAARTFAADPHAIARTAGRVNLRLRLSLDDLQTFGIYFPALWANATGEYEQVNAQLNVSGKIYYRVRF